MNQKFTAHRLTLVLALSVGASSPNFHNVCEGFAPPNDMYIPADVKIGGLEQEQFTAVLDRLEGIYKPIIEARGGTLALNRNWDNGEVNAYADRDGNRYIVEMFGGMARHPLMTADSFMMIACHEFGHHLGGQPKVAAGDWASVEGQSDYFASTKCMRRAYKTMTPEELNNFTQTEEAPLAKEKCNAIFSNEKEQLYCLRSTLAGIALGHVLVDLSGSGASVALSTPTTAVFSGIDTEHPEAQCRLDTYQEGAVCNIAHTVEFSDANMTTGACNAGAGLRSKCWFNPATN